MENCYVCIARDSYEETRPSDVSSSGEMTLDVRRIVALPDDLRPLLARSEQEGFNMLRRLHDAWQAGTNLFDRPGEALFEARADGHLLGVCGLNADPYLDDPTVGRVRHLYVLPEARRTGVGRALVAEILDHARTRFTRLRLRTLNPEASRFYLALGFTPIDDDPHATHTLTLAVAANP
jgi:GNAT superfamily N-acetyltransferase